MKNICSETMHTRDAEKEDNAQICESLVALLKLTSTPLSSTASYQAITKLDLCDCGLSSLPSSLQDLKNLSILFCPKNKFVELPPEIGKCNKLQMVSFKMNGMTSIHPESLQVQLRWLILTDNCIEQVPKTIGRCCILQKLMLSGNKLKTLPKEISNCRRLELVRLAANSISELPMAFLELPSLSWIALGSNPLFSHVSQTWSETPMLVFDDPTLDDPGQGQLLGNGASGITRKYSLKTMEEETKTLFVAIKQYYGAMTSDGDPREERLLSVAASCLDSDNLIEVKGQTKKGSLVMEFLQNYKAIASPPSFKSCSRDVYNPAETIELSANQAMSLISGLLKTLTKLHAKGICHGDFYGHNILIQTAPCGKKAEHLKMKLSDFGAAFFYDGTSDYGARIEKIEVRSFGHFVEEVVGLLTKSCQASQILKELCEDCFNLNQNMLFKQLQAKWVHLLEQHKIRCIV